MVGFGIVGLMLHSIYRYLCTMYVLHSRTVHLSSEKRSAGVQTITLTVALTLLTLASHRTACVLCEHWFVQGRRASPRSRVRPLPRRAVHGSPRCRCPVFVWPAVILFYFAFLNLNSTALERESVSWTDTSGYAYCYFLFVHYLISIHPEGAEPF